MPEYVCLCIWDEAGGCREDQTMRRFLLRSLEKMVDLQPVFYYPHFAKCVQHADGWIVLLQCENFVLVSTCRVGILHEKKDVFFRKYVGWNSIFRNKKGRLRNGVNFVYPFAVFHLLDKLF